MNVSHQSDDMQGGSPQMSGYHGRKEYGITKVILVKGITLSMNKADVIKICEKFGTIEDHLFIWDRQFAFIQYENVDQAMQCYKHFQMCPEILYGQEVKVLRTGRYSIDHSQQQNEQRPNKVLLIIFDKGVQKISKPMVYQIFEGFGDIDEILNFKRKYHMVLL
jgi:hypothetical protein